MYPNCDVLFVCGGCAFPHEYGYYKSNKRDHNALYYLRFMVYNFIITTSKVCARRFLPYSNRPGPGGPFWWGGGHLISSLAYELTYAYYYIASSLNHVVSNIPYMIFGIVLKKVPYPSQCNPKENHAL